MGLLGELSHRQEQFRGLFRDLYPDGVSVTDVDEDRVVTVAVVHYEMGRREDDPNENDIITAIEFLDHLDTLGGQVTWKEN